MLSERSQTQKAVCILYDANLYDILEKQNYRNNKNKNQLLPETGG